MAPIVGIDLGTTHSLVAVMKGARPEILSNRLGKRLTPSVVGIDKHGELVTGELARKQVATAPERTIAEVKRLMGTAEKVTLGARTYSPQEISGLILRSLKEDAEAALGEKISEAIITVPAYFTDAQRQATKDAGALAGLKVERILNEPTAAALAYGLDHLDKEQYVLVFDLGGGTFDVSVLEMFEGVLDVKASAGNNHLGGTDLDALIVTWLLTQCAAQGLDLKADRRALARLKLAAEQAKIELSSAISTVVSLPAIGILEGAAVNLEVDFTRALFEQLCGPLIKSTLGPVERALKDAKLEAKAIHEIVLVGGSSRIPYVWLMLEEFFGKKPRGGVHPDEAIALGAAIQAGLKEGSITRGMGIMIADVAPFTLGVEVTGHANQHRVSGLFSPIIPRNCKVPVSRTEKYFTSTDDQKQVEVKVYQGEDRFVRNNTFLDSYIVEGLPPKPAGQEGIEITFTYDINGILAVKTKVSSTGKEAVLRVDKSAQRMSAADREESRKRLESEWAAAHGPPAAAAAAVAAPAPAPAPAVKTGPQKMLARAKEQLATPAGSASEGLKKTVKALEDALASNDAAAIATAEARLTDALFDLEP